MKSLRTLLVSLVSFNALTALAQPPTFSCVFKDVVQGVEKTLLITRGESQAFDVGSINTSVWINADDYFVIHLRKTIDGKESDSESITYGAPAMMSAHLIVDNRTQASATCHVQVPE